MHAFNRDINVQHRMVLYEGAEVSPPSYAAGNIRFGKYQISVRFVHTHNLILRLGGLNPAHPQ